MAAVDYTHQTTAVSMVTWSGTNVDEIIAYVGGTNVQYRNGQLEVFGIDVPLTYKVAKYTAGGAFYGVLSPAHVTANFTQV